MSKPTEFLLLFVKIKPFGLTSDFLQASFHVSFTFFDSVSHTLPETITITVLWQLLHLRTSTHSYMLLAFKKPKSAEVTSRATRIINMEQESRLKKHTECSTPNKSG